MAHEGILRTGILFVRRVNGKHPGMVVLHLIDDWPGKRIDPVALLDGMYSPLHSECVVVVGAVGVDDDPRGGGCHNLLKRAD